MVHTEENALREHFKGMLLEEKTLELFYHEVDLESFVTRLNG